MKNIFLRSELIKEAGISEVQLVEYESKKLIQPSGQTDENVPFYTKALLEKVKQISALFVLGYQLEDVQKIVKKVGLPKNGESKDEEHNVENYITIGSLANKVGISARTIKHWEEKGIVEPDMRSDGGFRLYSNAYVFLCKLIIDLQLFGYSLDEIKTISDYFREFLSIQANPEQYSCEETEERLNSMQEEIKRLNEKMKEFKEGIERWEDLLKTKNKELSSLKGKNTKRKTQKE